MSKSESSSKPDGIMSTNKAFHEKTQQRIREYLAGRKLPDTHTLRCFVGMIETGEAVYDDFAAVGGSILAADVAKAKSKLDEAGDE